MNIDLHLLKCSQSRRISLWIMDLYGLKDTSYSLVCDQWWLVSSMWSQPSQRQNCLIYTNNIDFISHFHIAIRKLIRDRTSCRQCTYNLKSTILPALFVFRTQRNEKYYKETTASLFKNVQLEKTYNRM